MSNIVVNTVPAGLVQEGAKIFAETMTPHPTKSYTIPNPDQSVYPTLKTPPFRGFWTK